MTYANVVATLALFVALGGSAYAVTQITSREVRNRSLRGVDLRRDTVSGKEVKESKLGIVPSAQSAGTASTASAASVAANANTLGGQGPEAFEKSARTEFGRAPANPPSLAARQTLLDWPVLGARLTTSTTNSGCAAEHPGIRFVNTRTSGAFLRIIDNGLVGNLPPNSDINLCSATAGQFNGAIGDVSGQTLWFRCVGIEGEIRCLGTRSEP